MLSRLNILLFSGLWLLSACGFEPMYGESSALSAHSPLQGNLVIDPIGTRAGQVLRIALEDRFNPEGLQVANADYHLQIKLRQVLVPTVITGNGTIQRYDVRFESDFKLLHTGEAKPIFIGTLHRSGSYNVATNANFSTYEAEQDTIERVLKEMAEDYVLRLTGYFASKP
jgi:LPS-assembly lipoprotein